MTIFSYLQYMTKLQVWAESLVNANLCIVGDFNASCANMFGKLLEDFAAQKYLIISYKACLPSDTFTYLSDAHGTVSWLDHCISSPSLHQSIDNMNVLYKFSTSDHFSLVISLSCQSLPLFVDKVNAPIGAKRINWNKLSSDQKAGYYMATEVNLSKISLPQAVLECSNPLCNDQMHLKSIDNFYECIISSLLSASDAVCSSNRHYQLGAKQLQVPGWNNEVKSYHDQARSVFLD